MNVQKGGGNPLHGREPESGNAWQNVHGEPIRVLLADPDPDFRRLLTEALKLRGGMKMVAECGDGAEVPIVCESVSPHVAVLNLYLSRVDGVEVTYRLSQTAPRTKVLIMSDREDPYAMEAIRLGAAGFILKNMEAPSILEAVRIIAHGGYYIHPVMMGPLVQEFRRLSRMEGGFQHLHTVSTPISWKEVLTYREMEVLRLMSQGKNNRTISEHLYISEKTVKNNVSNILYKLNVQDRTQAVLLAIKYGWVQLV
jgi:two-component system response regulator DegU